MSGSIKKAVDKLFANILKSKGAIERLTQPSATGAGERMFPARTAKNDAKYGIRIDKGEAVAGHPNLVRIKLQANSNAESKTIRDIAKKDPHGVLATVDIDNTQEATEENARKVLEDLKSKVDI